MQYNKNSKIKHALAHALKQHAKPINVKQSSKNVKQCFYFKNKKTPVNVQRSSDSFVTFKLICRQKITKSVVS